MGNGKKTSNIQHPTSNIQWADGGERLDGGCSSWGFCLFVRFDLNGGNHLSYAVGVQRDGHRFADGFGGRGGAGERDDAAGGVDGNIPRRNFRFPDELAFDRRGGPRIGGGVGDRLPGSV